MVMFNFNAVQFSFFLTFIKKLSKKHLQIMDL